MAKKQSKKFDAVGWKFWAVAFVVLLTPSVYGMSQIVRENTKYFVIVFMAVLAAGAAAALVTWAVNSIIQLVISSNRKKQKKTHR
ncbi:MAG: hypothetical protein K1Y02_04370 [Candidatus Hydrogenedentes bacterium]|nr:hypothetical protein [Candidatus Hydrogenedentota bacterium]